MRNGIMICLVIVLVIAPSSLLAMGHSYENIYDPDSHYKEYTVHTFYFNWDEVVEMRQSPNATQPYADQVIKQMWEVADLGDPEDVDDWRAVARGLGSLYLAFELNKLAKDWHGGGDYLVVEFKSRHDTGGKIAFDLWDNAVGLWKKLSGN